MDPSGKYLIASSKQITVWDLSTRQKVNTLTGHSTDIFRMQFIDYLSHKDENNNSNKKYFLSAAQNDRIINLWSIDPSSATSDKQTNSLASFLLNDNPVYFDVYANKQVQSKLSSTYLQESYQMQSQFNSTGYLGVNNVRRKITGESYC